MSIFMPKVVKEKEVIAPYMKVPRAFNCWEVAIANIINYFITVILFDESYFLHSSVVREDFLLLQNSHEFGIVKELQH